MQIESDNFDNAVDRLKMMSSADRKAVLARLGLEQRLAIERALSGQRVDADVEQGLPSSQWHRHFSPVIARMLSEIEGHENAKAGTGKPLTTATCNALSECANAYAEELSKGKAAKPVSIIDLIGKLVFPARVK